VEIEQMARLLASKRDSQLLGQTEFELRDLVHGLGAKALEIALRQKRWQERMALPER